MSAPARAREPRPAPEALVGRTDILRRETSKQLHPERQAEMGQFFTPAPIARLMASMFQTKGRSLRLLDAGAGSGALTAAFIAEMCSKRQPPQEIHVESYEIDASVVPFLRQSLDLCAVHCRETGTVFTAEVRQEDFIEESFAALRGGLFTDPRPQFDAAILNPPYRKIDSDSRTRRLFDMLGVGGSTNLYSAFVALALGFLKPHGELVAITPRSFCNGPYFREFRRHLLDNAALCRIHAFDTRDQAFSDDAVLQENVIIYLKKAPTRQGRVVVSSTLGPDDEWPGWREVAFDRIVRPDDPERVLHVPTDRLSEVFSEQMQAFTASLPELGLDVSTGRVVDFRAAAFIRHEPESGAVPLIYPSHIVRGQVFWPRLGKKPNALAVADETRDLLVPNGFYVLVKRFSSKEERRRIVAAVHDPTAFADSEVAFENHLNYFHARGRPLTKDLAKGIAGFLNSTLVDSFFRDWSGHTQVNAADLRRLRFPDREQLTRLGAAMSDGAFDQDSVDQLVEDRLLSQPRLGGLDPVRAKKRIREALAILKHLGLPREQQNERSALTLLALLSIQPRTTWAEASNALRGITEMMTYFSKHYGKTYAPNTRETIRRYTVHQFVQAGIAIPNPDLPTRPTNSPKAVYQITPGVLELIRLYGTEAWEPRLREHLTSAGTLQRRYASERAARKIPLVLPGGQVIGLSPGGQNVLVEKIVNEFCPVFTPGARPLYVGDTAEKWAYFDPKALGALGVAVEAHGKMPDVVIYHEAKNWLVLVEAVTSHGPMSPKRRHELKVLFAGAKADLVFVTAFLTRRDLVKYLGDIAWETEVWVAEAPTHMIHFNGERFLGPSDG